MEIEYFTQRYIITYFNNKFSMHTIGGMPLYADNIIDLVPVELNLPPEILAMRIYKNDEHYIYVDNEYYYSLKGENIKALILRAIGKEV